MTFSARALASSRTVGGTPWALKTSTAPCGTSSIASRSEEHTSELQSRLHLVCRLLLAKTKEITYQAPPTAPLVAPSTKILTPPPTPAMPAVAAAPPTWHAVGSPHWIIRTPSPACTTHD